MIVLLFIAIHFVSADNGIVVCFIFFYVINLLYVIFSSAVVGINGNSLKILLPINVVLFFMLGILFLFNIEDAFFMHLDI